MAVNRRRFLRTTGYGAAALAMLPLGSCGNIGSRKPNIIFILADDLGYGELGSYGQEKIRTPHLDRLAAEGMRFTQHYSGSAVCAPSRCVFLTGRHTGHSYIRGNDEMRERGDVWGDPALEGQRPIPPETVTIGHLLQNAGYTTGVIGKWGLGGPGSSGEPNAQGFDHWYGYLCQRVAHNYFPTHLWKNGGKQLLEGNDYFSPRQKFPEDKDPLDPASYREYSGQTYSMDPMAEEARNFIKANTNHPFFLYLPFPVPHVSLQVPEDSIREYEGAFPEEPYSGDRGYLPHPTPRAAYAAMITRMDREIGSIMTLLKELGIDDNTLVLFSSDNGPTFNGGADSEFFNSAGPFRGLKASLYEGGIRVPLIARWPGKIQPGSVNDHVSAFWDFLPTFTELTDINTPVEIDGLSLLPALLGKKEKQQEHDYLYWELNGNQAVRLGDWKAVRLKGDSKKIELYNLKTDIGESRDVAEENPDIIGRMADIMKTGRTESEHFPLVRSRE